MGMIRVSDYAEKKIKEMANGRTVTATVDSLLSGGGDFSELKDYFEKKFAHLESLIADATVERLDGGGGKSQPTFQNKVYLKWEHAQPLLYEVMEEKDYASTYASNVCHEANEELELYAMDGCLYLPGWGGDTLIATISPKIRDYLSSKGYDIM